MVLHQERILFEIHCYPDGFQNVCDKHLIMLTNFLALYKYGIRTIYNSMIKLRLKFVNSHVLLA